jgi:hypothetical protein
MFGLSFALPALARRADRLIAAVAASGAWHFNQPAASGHLLTAGF